MALTSSRFSVASWASVFFSILFLLSFIHPTFAAEKKYVQYTTENGQTVNLADDRKPALYTQNFGDCLGSSLINVTRFDAAYYKDNMTVLFHLEGNTAVANESLMLYIGVFAYGLARFDLTFNPCNAQIYSLCPMNRSVPIEANGIIPVSQADVGAIPPIALTIPDFEGQAILRIFANSTQSEIGCYSAVVTNGQSFSHPAAVGTVFGIFAVIALLSSFATAVYGDHIPTTRTHYAHSLSVLVVFAVFQHIYFTGALSMNWPSVLVAFWSNYAWSGGMVYTKSMQNSINQLIGSNKGNTSIVGAAGSGSAAENLGGGYQISQIYKRSLFNYKSRTLEQNIARGIGKRSLANSTTGYSWYGSPAKPGLPLPGNFSGFPGTLAEQNIPASNAFITGFLWFLILLVIVAASVAAFKWLLEGFAKVSWIKKDRLAYFRAHWIQFTEMAVLRTWLIAFFMMIFLTTFQFTYKGSGGVTALAAIVFLVFTFGLFGAAGYACYYRLRYGQYEIVPDRAHLARAKVLGHVSWFRFELESSRSEKPDVKKSVVSMPWKRLQYADEDSPRANIHQDEDYTKKFGWLSARFRKSRWWFFAAWLIYEFTRACFYGGAAGHPMVQVFGLLVVEFIALIIIVQIKPFEGARLNMLMVYVLGFSKIASVALSSAFDSRFNLPRITTTVIGVVVIVIQGILTILLMIAILVGAVSSYMSITRNQEEFRPRKWAPYREKYFAHLTKAATDLPPPPTPVPEEPKEPYFNVASVRRCPKIEDDDVVGDFIEDTIDPLSSRASVAGPVTNRASRAGSVRSQASHSNVPFGARVHRASWNSRDFNSWHEASNRNSQLMSRSGLPNRASDASLGEHTITPPKTRTPPVRGVSSLEVKKSLGGKSRELPKEGSNDEIKE